MSLVADNIKFIRETLLFKETQIKFAKYLGISNTMLSNYERGITPPPSDVLDKIARRINISVDQLINQDLASSYSPSLSFPFDLIKPLSKKMYPLVKTPCRINSITFNRAYTLASEFISLLLGENILSDFSIDVNLFAEALSLFKDAADKEKIDEAKINYISLVLQMWPFFYSFEGVKLKTINSYSKSIPADKMNEILGSISSSNSNNWDNYQKWYYSEFNPTIISYLQDLKNTQYSDICEYFIAIKYNIGMVESEHSRQTLVIIGEEMFGSLSMLGNKYAKDLTSLILKEFT